MSKRHIHFLFAVFSVVKAGGISKAQSTYYTTAYKILIALQVIKSEVCLK